MREEQLDIDGTVPRFKNTEDIRKEIEKEMLLNKKDA
jgi:hypothetical protein